jgi:hypothetical protein
MERVAVLFIFGSIALLAVIVFYILHWINKVQIEKLPFEEGMRMEADTAVSNEKHVHEKGIEKKETGNNVII